MRKKTLFAQYLYDRARIFGIFLIMVAIFAFVIHLYALPVAAVGYACLLSFTVGLGACTIDFIRYVRRHRALSALRTGITYGLAGLPPAKSYLEKDYQTLLELLYADRQRLILAYDKATDDMADYYTLWAHQIKTPIAAMKLLLQTEQADFTALSSALFDIEQYVQMALNYIRLESASTDYVLKQIPLDRSIRSAVRKYARQFILKGLSLCYDGVDKTVLTDEKWLTFVIEQVLSNAVKYTFSGKISIYMEQRQLVIEDTGVGIDKADLPRIFDKGYTGYNGREENASTGLGLYLCRRVLGNLSHTISIQSQLDQGTKVLIGFPDETLIPE